jgi:tetratricopeptide (TPR) repeat protein
MGQMCLQKKEYSKAIEYLSDAVKGVTTQKDKYKAYLYLGHAYNGVKSYSAARTAYNNAAETDRTKGEPYRMIAQLYAGSSSTASEDNVSGRSAYWAAVDKLQKSKSVDSSEENVEACNALISRYSAHFPKQTDAFMAGLENGNRFTVPGWIGESTVVRTR